LDDIRGGRPRSRVDRFGYLPPNWFATVMGTGIVANAIPALGVRSGPLFDLGRAVWLLAALGLIVLSAAAIRAGRSWLFTWLDDMILTHFFGAISMAFLTVGAGTLVYGSKLFGRAAVGIAFLVWVFGTVAGVGIALVIPWRQLTRRAMDPTTAFAGWLMPVVPPMVSAATGAPLVHHLPAEDQRAMLLACYGLFGFTLLASAIVLIVLLRKLVEFGPGPDRLIPTLFIVLGPLGQSVTASGQLGNVAPTVLGHRAGDFMHGFGLGYGLVVIGLAMLWILYATGVLLGRWGRPASAIPFSLAWWSFTFPLGTCVTATAGLARRTGNDGFSTLAISLYVVLVVTWLYVGAKTVHALVAGTLFATQPR